MNLISEINIESSFGFTDFMKVFIDQVEKPDLSNECEFKHYEKRKLNLHRTQKWLKIFKPSQELIDTVTLINSPQNWMVITESWCGDSAQSLPIIVKTADLNPRINLKIILRDSNPNIMDRYLTNGTKSIPKLIAFDEKGTELFLWGPRPAEAKNLIMKLKNEGLEKSEINKQLHLWYAKNKGTAMEKELISLIKLVEIGKN